MTLFHYFFLVVIRRILVSLLISKIRYFSAFFYFPLSTYAYTVYLTLFFPLDISLTLYLLISHTLSFLFYLNAANSLLHFYSSFYLLLLFPILISLLFLLRISLLFLLLISFLLFLLISLLLFLLLISFLLFFLLLLISFLLSLLLLISFLLFPILISSLLFLLLIS